MIITKTHFIPEEPKEILACFGLICEYRPKQPNPLLENPYEWKGPFPLDKVDLDFSLNGTNEYRFKHLTEKSLNEGDLISFERPRFYKNKVFNELIGKNPIYQIKMNIAGHKAENFKLLLTRNVWVPIKVRV